VLRPGASAYCCLCWGLGSGRVEGEPADPGLPVPPLLSADEQAELRQRALGLIASLTVGAGGEETEPDTGK